MTEAKTALWQQVITNAAASETPEQRTQRSANEAELRTKAIKEQYLERASLVLDAYLKSEEGILALELLFTTKETIAIASYRHLGETTYLYISGTGFYSTNKFGPDPATLSKHKTNIIEHGHLSIVSSYEDLHKMIEKIRDKLNEIAEQFDKSKRSPSPKPQR